MSETYSSLPVVTNTQATLILPTQTNIQAENFEQQQQQQQQQQAGNPLNVTPAQEDLAQQQQVNFQASQAKMENSYENGNVGGGNTQQGQATNSIEHPKLQRLTNDQKREICLYHLNNPNLRQGQLAKHFNTQQYTISRILKERNKWLNLDGTQIDINNQQAAPTVSPTGYNNELQQTIITQSNDQTYPDLEAELAGWYQELKGSDSKPSDKEVREKANSLRLKYNVDENSITFSNQWVEGFKKRHGFKKTYYKRNRFQFEQENDELPIIMMENNNVIQAPAQSVAPPNTSTFPAIPHNGSNGPSNVPGYRNIRPRASIDQNQELVNNTNNEIPVEAYTQPNGAPQEQSNTALTTPINYTYNHFNHPKIIKYGVEFLNYFEMTGGINNQEKAMLAKLINQVRMRYTVQEGKYLKEYLKSQPNPGLNIDPRDIEALERIANQTEM
ncbi:hypothetical protein CONCODRAFT_78690 [Conidiobolus coronatus NRRL 28638]|uniref:HTH CENPB-type domain-containing protein n=1 Tax=Conidiobolus coronatus (strain ATCC 28846 / CBS 209.66 / NRRL 28638) TaxID=796925 RepID=A0A137P704_CONC2|nr:hypothetical protein CONCODRAFT_78690 [Conidiobolus coronatus NRRL 28638]|eukprot:KXN70778.1 hypothetical protein CONCODRAFT_78690 [Conidiobolus coronatus NRRL 28638]